MKKSLIGIFIFILLFALGATRVHAEDDIVDPQEEIEEIEEIESQEATIVIGECVYGSVTFIPEQPKVGDIVTVFPSAQVFCALESVKVNGVALVKNEQSEYQFTAVEGENVITINCVVNKDDMQIIADLLDNAKKGNWEEIFSFENIVNLINWAISIFFGSGFLITLLKNKKIKAITADEIATKMNGIIPETVTKTILSNFQPIIDGVNKAITDVNTSCDTLVRCMMLMQEGTPEARLAVSKELAGLNRSGLADIEKQVKEIINAEVTKLEETKQQQKELLESLISKNNTIITKVESASIAEVQQTKEEQFDDELRGRI